MKTQNNYLNVRALSVKQILLISTIVFQGVLYAQPFNVDSAANFIYSTGFTPVTGQVAAPSPTSARPTKGTVFADPNFGIATVRATDWANEPPSGFARNDYSRRQAFNANNTRFLANSLNGAWHLYDANTLSYIQVLPGLAGDAEPQWHPTNPDLLYWIPLNGGMVLNLLNVVTGINTVAADFTTAPLPWTGVARVWTKSEGSPSADGRYWCFMAETNGFNILGVFTYDLQTQTVLGTRTLSNRPDHVSMSPSGRWCEISGGDVSGATVAWNPTFTQSRVLHQGGEHSDLILGADGSDYYVAIDYQSNAGDLYMFNIDSNLRTVLFPTYIQGTATAYHVSGKNFSKPGWFLLSTYAEFGSEKWLHKRIMAVELKANPTIINLAHHHSIYNGYWTEPHASVNRDFTRVLFSSNWGNSTTTDVDAFMLRLPDNLIPSLICSAPSAPTITTNNITICNGNTTTLTATGSGTISWYNAPTGGTFLGNGATFTTPSLTTTTTYYAQDSTCSISATRTSVTVTVKNHSTFSQTLTLCVGNSITVGSNTYNTTGVFVDVLVAANGCDSIVTTNLTVNPTTTSTDVRTACNSFTWIDNNTYTTSNNTATHTLINAAGCDSVVTLNLTINTIDNTTSLINNTITANATGATYRWLNCDSGNVVIPGETAQSFNVTSTGNYAAEITIGNCVDTSACVNVIITSINENKSALDFKIYPNPSIGIFTITAQAQANFDVTVVDMLGKVVYTKTNNNESLDIDLTHQKQGMYFLTIKSDNTIITEKIIFTN